MPFSKRIGFAGREGGALPYLRGCVYWCWHACSISLVAVLGDRLALLSGLPGPSWLQVYHVLLDGGGQGRSCIMDLQSCGRDIFVTSACDIACCDMVKQRSANVTAGAYTCPFRDTFRTISVAAASCRAIAVLSHLVTPCLSPPRWRAPWDAAVALL